MEYRGVDLHAEYGVTSTSDDPYDEIRATPCVPWKSSRATPESRQSVCQIGAPTLVGPHHAPVDAFLDHQSAHRSETGRSSALIDITEHTTRLEVTTQRSTA